MDKPVGGRGASLFGKIPARPDFVRERFAGPAALQLDRWLVTAAENLHFARQKLPPVVVRYALCAGEDVLLGVLAPSRDQVGRDFPITVFCSVPASELAGRLSGLALWAAPFLDSAEQLLSEIFALSPADALARLDALPLLDAGLVQQAQQQAEHGVSGVDASDFAARAFGDSASAAPYYGFFTFLTAASAVRDAPSDPATVLACPMAADTDLWSWLSLANRVLSWRSSVPSVFWVQNPAPRMLLSLGPAPTMLLQFLADPEHKSARLWPLVTQRPEAAERARSILQPVLPAFERRGLAQTDALLSSLAAWDGP